MTEKDKRGYRRKGLRFGNLDFRNRAEQTYVKGEIERIAAKVRDFRKQKGLSQEELAELISASVSTVKFIEENQRAPSLPMLLKLLYVLDREATIWS